MKAQLSVAVAQITSVDSVDSNLQQIRELIESVPHSRGVDLFCFPENSLYMRIQEGEAVPGLRLTDPAFKALAEIATRRQTHLHIGASPLFINEKLFNASILIGPNGSVTSAYQKIHLFDIDLVGEKRVRESDVFQHGSKPNVFHLHGWKIGETICYDLRFSELYAFYAAQDCDVILVPSAFLPKTGAAHWEILLRARAIESQAYVVASAQGGQHRGVRGGQRETYGHGMIVDPWGLIAAELVSQPSIEVHHLLGERVQQVRAQIPMKSHRRL